MNKLERLSTRFRTLPPAGDFPSPMAIVECWRDLRQISSSFDAQGRLAIWSETCRQLRTGLGAGDLTACASGKDALFRAFSRLKAQAERDVVIVSAYTCPDIAAAALKAGCRILPVDINENTLEPLVPDLGADRESRLCAVVLSNLYGLCDKLGPWKPLAERARAGVIDDACQAAYSRESGIPLGFRDTAYGILSFGRGKALGGLGGGALLTKLVTEETAEEQARVSGWDCAGLESLHSWSQAICLFLKATLSWAFLDPRLYWIPAGIPFLRLGKTVCRMDFPVGDPSVIELLCALIQLRKREWFRRAALDNARCWHELIKCRGLDVTEPFVERGYAFDGEIVPIRYAVLFRTTEERERAFAALSCAGLGASRSYAGTLFDFPELADGLIVRDCPGAKRAAQCLLTLPVHPQVLESDIERAIDVIRKVL